MDKPAFHLHMDAAHLPAPLLDRMINEGGFHYDDFQHEIEVNGESIPARHLTKYLFAPTTSIDVRKECLKIKQWADEFSFVGLIQCEYVMEDIEWQKITEEQTNIQAPFILSTRNLEGKRNDRFKKHEIHLEIDKSSSSAHVINALKRCGFHLLENERCVTFTIAGHSKEMLKLRSALNDFLAVYGNQITAKLTYEATAFWSLHGVESQSLPTILDKISLLN